MSLTKKYVDSLRHHAGSSLAGLRVARSWKLYAEFLSPAYQQHNVARLQHLESLGLSVGGKRVLELGAGVGDHTVFYLHRNCTVLAVDGRPECVRVLKQRLGVDARVMDLDREPEQIEKLGRFDIVHCYGLLYHLANPREFLLQVSKVGGMLLLETCVSIGDGFQVQRVHEAAGVPSQALHGKGCRPTRDWVFETLKLYYPFVYTTKTQPKHREFPIDWTSSSMPKRGLKRAVFVASRTPVTSAQLLDHLPAKHETW